MAAAMIGVDPHKALRTAVVISAAEEELGALRVRACAGQAEQLLAWAATWPQRTRGPGRRLRGGPETWTRVKATAAPGHEEGR